MEKQKPLCVFLVGDLGAGKATQSALLKKKLPLYDFDFGKEQDKLRRINPTLDALLARTTDKGLLTPTRIYRAVVKKAINSIPLGKGILFDGGPKMPSEARVVARLLLRAGYTRIICIYLSVPWKETVKRNLKRGGYFGKKRRADDTLASIKQRYKFVQASIKRAMPVHKSLYPFAKVSGTGTVKEVHGRVMRAVERLSRHSRPSSVIPARFARAPARRSGRE